jgi:hypothetical protein
MEFPHAPDIIQPHLFQSYDQQLTSISQQLKQADKALEALTTWKEAKDQLVILMQQVEMAKWKAEAIAANAGRDITLPNEMLMSTIVMPNLRKIFKHNKLKLHQDKQV